MTCKKKKKKKGKRKNAMSCKTFIHFTGYFFFCRKVLIFFLFLKENICCEYSLEAPQQAASNECHTMYMYIIMEKHIYLETSLIYSLTFICIQSFVIFQTNLKIYDQNAILFFANRNLIF